MRTQQYLDAIGAISAANAVFSAYVLCKFGFKLTYETIARVAYKGRFVNHLHNRSVYFLTYL